MNKLTPQQYIETNGNFCPNCGTSNIESGPISAGDSVAEANITCNVCGATWQDVWKLHGYYNLEVPVKTT